MKTIKIRGSLMRYSLKFKSDDLVNSSGSKAITENGNDITDNVVTTPHVVKNNSPGFTDMCNGDGSSPHRQLDISSVDAQWVQTVMDGWAEPLRGFMRENDYLECVHFRTITRNGKKFSQSIPIVLQCSDEQKIQLEGKGDIELVYCGKALATLKQPEFFPFRKEEHCARLFGTTNSCHPTIMHMNKWGSWLIGGEISNYKRISWNDDLDNYRLSVDQIRTRIDEISSPDQKRAVVAFQLRNPLHNGHVLLIEETMRSLKNQGYEQTIVLLHPLGGWTKSDDVPLHVRMRQHQIYIDALGWKETCLLAIFPSPMLYAGPVEVQWHASARSRVGVTHYIVGRDPAGIPHPSDKNSNLYDPTHGAKVLSMTKHLNPVEFVSFPVVAFSKSLQTMAFFDPKREEDFEFISGTLMRSLARKRQSPPAGFMHADAWSTLVNFYS